MDVLADINALRVRPSRASMILSRELQIIGIHDWFRPNVKRVWTLKNEQTNYVQSLWQS